MHRCASRLDGCCVKATLRHRSTHEAPGRVDSCSRCSCGSCLCADAGIRDLTFADEMYELAKSRPYARGWILRRGVGVSASDQAKPAGHQVGQESEPLSLSLSALAARCSNPVTLARSAAVTLPDSLILIGVGLFVFRDPIVTAL